MEHHKLYRSLKDSWEAGISGGIAEYFKIDSTIIRILFVIFALTGGGGVLLYIILWIVIPLEPFNESEKPQPEFDSVQNEKINDEEQGRDWRNGSVVAGMILVLLGILFLVKELMPTFVFRRFWPILLILLGAVIIITSFKKINKSKHEL